MKLSTFKSECDYVQAIENAINALNVTIKTLNAHLDTLCIKSCRLYKVEEQRLDKTLNDKPFDGSCEIECCVISDDFVAFTESKKAFKDFYNHSGTTSKNTFRAAGYIQIAPADNSADSIETLIQLVDDINAQKKSLATLFKANVVRVDDENYRFDREDFFIANFPHLIKLQVTRKLRLMSDSTIRYIDFHWSSKMLSDKVTPQDMIDKIKRMLHQIGRASELSSSAELKAQALKITSQYLESLPSDTELRLRRPIPPQPAVNVLRIGNKKFNFTCPIPFILISDHTDVSGLQNYQPQQRPSRTKGRYECVDAALNIYRLVK
ncbi:DNA replication terminus site-binding protein [Shewanella aestuarii]|uniref:DNA replication terminus site-binding protein n=1 Tax=Shewanella aestuarii TaxID=1028752 RepID=A0A6G9QR73_9GAMM|nr:DNA replication terminus site-binding protein [Shewanella aestuarii]QIR16555.1 DNA replication terminus site-binding protein [Shewanella aestuarii]